jgi:DNA repair exonuclease SbcCD ATPase subunit
MEQSNSHGTPFKIPLQTPQAPHHVAPAQSSSWADYDDNDTDWIPEDVKVRIAVRANATINSNIFEGSEQQSAPTPSSSSKKSHLDDDETEAPTQPVPIVGSFSGSVLSPKPIQQLLESNGNSDKLTDVLFSNFSGFQRPDDDEVKIMSHFSDSSDEDASPTEPTSLSAQKIPSLQQQTPSDTSIPSTPCQLNESVELDLGQPQASSPSPVLQLPDVATKPTDEEEGPHIPPPGADVAYEQLARLHRLCSNGDYVMNAAQMMLYKSLKPVQDKQERWRKFSRADSWRFDVLAERKLVEGQKGARGEVWGFSRLDPRWESLEGRLERERRGHHDTKFALEKVTGHLENSEKMRREAEEKLEWQTKEADFMRAELEMEVWEMQRVLDSKEAETQRLKFELRVKAEEIELVKQKFGEKFQELVDKCKQKVATVNKELQESKQSFGDVEVEQLQEELNQHKAWNSILKLDKQEFSGQVGELQGEQRTWFEIFGVHRARRQKRRRSDGEIYTRTQEIESLQCRLMNCSERLCEARSRRSEFKKTYATLQQELSTEKKDNAELLKETQTLRTELKKTREDAEDKETKLKAQTAEMETLVIDKDQLAVNLESFKRKFAMIQEAAPLETLIDLRTQIQHEREAKEKIQTENSRLRAVVGKLGHLQPQDLTELQEKHRRQLDGFNEKVAELQKQNEKLKHDYQINYSNLHMQLNQVREAKCQAQEANEPLLKHVEELSSEVKDLQEKLRKTEKDLSDKTDQCDALECAPKKMLEYMQQKWQHYQQRSDLIASINELNSRIKEFEMLEEGYKKRFKRQEERLRGLEDDLLHANACLGNRNEPLKVAKINRKRREMCKEGQIEVKRQMDIDAMRWAEREERWEQLFELRTRFDEDGNFHLERGSEHPSLDTVRRKMTQIEKQDERKKQREKKDEDERDLERVTAAVSMAVRKWDWD